MGQAQAVVQPLSDAQFATTKGPCTRQFLACLATAICATKTQSNFSKVLAKHHSICICAIDSACACMQVLKATVYGNKSQKSAAKGKAHAADLSAFTEFQKELHQGLTPKRLLPFELKAFGSLPVLEVSPSIGADDEQS